MIVNIGDMARMYALARVCIVAAAGEDAEAGLPGVSSMRTEYGAKACQLSENLLLGRAVPSLSEILQNSKWKSRG
jgi:hypothetical protein